MITLGTIVTAFGFKLMLLGYAAMITEFFRSPTQ
jgi:hypothetical protein